MKADGRCSDLIIVYGSVADKDVDAVLHLIPEYAVCIFTQARSRRALEAEKIRDKYLNFCAETSRSAAQVYVVEDVPSAVSVARQMAGEIVGKDASARPLIYIGGSTYIVSEAIASGYSTL